VIGGRSRSRSRFFLAISALLLVGCPASAVETSLVAELSGGPGWRVSFGQDVRAPGFEAVTGGIDLLLGFELNHTVALVVGGRARMGALTGYTCPAGSADCANYLETTGDLGAQFHIGDSARVRAGVVAGRAWLDGTRLAATLVGGWLGAALDLFTFASGRVAAALTVRFDLSGFPEAAGGFPAMTMALCGGLGGRY
jgi:hypothetical protein